MAQAKSGQPKQAATTIRSAVNLEPDNALWRIRLAQYLLDSGDRGESAKVLATIDSGRLDLRTLTSDVKGQLEQIRARVRAN